jgi:hypothetical protein
VPSFLLATKELLVIKLIHTGGQLIIIGLVEFGSRLEVVFHVVKE